MGRPIWFSWRIVMPWVSWILYFSFGFGLLSNWRIVYISLTHMFIWSDRTLVSVTMKPENNCQSFIIKVWLNSFHSHVFNLIQMNGYCCMLAFICFRCCFATRTISCHILESNWWCTRFLRISRTISTRSSSAIHICNIYFLHWNSFMIELYCDKSLLVIIYKRIGYFIKIHLCLCLTMQWKLSRLFWT